MKKIYILAIALMTGISLFASEGALTGRFTININGDQVVFSQGNLQYLAYTEAEHFVERFRFAANQYDFVGDASNGNVYENDVKCDNSLISDMYEGWIDLFGWGTGNQAYKTYTNDPGNDYSNFHEWGPITNASGKWRTLTNDEWSYVLEHHQTGLATVNEIHGCILLPDVWTTPDGLTFNASNEHWSDNTYIGDQWLAMQTAGAVFLPAAGERYGTAVSKVQTDGAYWSSDEVCGETECRRAPAVVFNEGNISADNSKYKYYGYSVRLVQPAPHAVDFIEKENHLTGRFTVNAEGKQVHFSQGNLQYNAAAEDEEGNTGFWQFAENQWDYLGAQNEGRDYDYDKWIDLFTWGTGDDPLNKTALSFTDWGINPIHNGGNQPNQWRTMTNAEWEYLLEVRPGHDTLRAIATVNEVKGVVLLPDNWSAPAGLALTEFDVYDHKWTTNIYTAEQWAQLEAAGAVFLPCSGYSVSYNPNRFIENTEGSPVALYWTTDVSPYSGHVSVFHYTDYSDGYFGIGTYYVREDYYSVRLVQDATDLSVLADAVNDATAYYNEIKDNEIYASIAAELQTAVATAEAVLNNPEATQEEIDAAVTALNDALQKAEEDVEKTNGIETVSSPQSDVSPRKVVRDGCLYIIRPDGKTYNALGAEVK